MRVDLMPFYMAKCLVTTLVVELLVAFILKVRDKKDLLNIALVNILTNPLLNAILIYINIFISLTVRNVSLVILEILIVFIEGYIYKKVLKYKRINVYLLSLILNASSFIIGQIINNFL